jgi:hypothetical protein
MARHIPNPDRRADCACGSPDRQSTAGWGHPGPEHAIGAVTANQQERPKTTPSRGLGGMPVAGIDGRKLPTRAGRWQAPECRTARARRVSPRAPPAGKLVPPIFKRNPRSYGQNEQVDEPAQEGQYSWHRVLTSLRGHERVHPRACVQHGCPRDYLAGPQNWLPTPGPGGLGRQRCGQPGGQVSGEGGQLRVGPRRQRLAHPQVELVFGQHALNERGLEGADHLFAVGVRGAQVTAASRSCRDLISQPCHHGTSPSTMHESVACNRVRTFPVRPFRAIPIGTVIGKMRGSQLQDLVAGQCHVTFCDIQRRTGSDRNRLHSSSGQLL